MMVQWEDGQVGIHLSHKLTKRVEKWLCAHGLNSLLKKGRCRWDCCLGDSVNKSTDYRFCAAVV